MWCYRFDEGWTLRAEGWPASSGRRAVAVLSPNPISLRRVGGVCETPSRVRSSIPLDPPTAHRVSLSARAVADPLPFPPLSPPQGRRPYEPSDATRRVYYARVLRWVWEIGDIIRQAIEIAGNQPASLRWLDAFLLPSGRRWGRRPRMRGLHPPRNGKSEAAEPAPSSVSLREPPSPPRGEGLEVRPTPPAARTEPYTSIWPSGRPDRRRGVTTSCPWGSQGLRVRALMNDSGRGR